MKHLKKHSFMDNFPYYGSIGFGVGILVVIIGALIELSSFATKIAIGLLTIIGIVIGLLNINRKEAVAFMVAGLILVLLLGQFLLLVGQNFFPDANELFFRLLTFFNALLIPAIIVVAGKIFFFAAKEE